MVVASVVSLIGVGNFRFRTVPLIIDTPECCGGRLIGMESYPASTIALAESPEPAVDSGPSPWVSAQAEFHASLQLLAERASFLTAASGVAIALPEGSSLTYCAAIGSSVSQAGRVVESDRPEITACMQHSRAVREHTNGEFKLLAPILAEDKAVGFFEVASKHEWIDQDVDAVTRLADLAAVALEHRVAATRAEAETWHGLHEQLSPVAWHAPANSEIAAAAEPKTESVQITAVNTCTACGFPVSPGRILCVECEQKSDAPVSKPGELFSSQNQESWISEHGYTAASLIVSALAAALILWLRR
jgi:hypothetical protein